MSKESVREWRVPEEDLLKLQVLLPACENLTPSTVLCVRNKELKALIFKTET